MRYSIDSGFKLPREIYTHESNLPCLDGLDVCILNYGGPSPSSSSKYLLTTWTLLATKWHVNLENLQLSHNQTLMYPHPCARKCPSNTSSNLRSPISKNVNLIAITMLSFPIAPSPTICRTQFQFDQYFQVFVALLKLWNDTMVCFEQVNQSSWGTPLEYPIQCSTNPYSLCSNILMS